MIVEGFCNHTAGGISFFSPEYGFASDSVIDFEVVLASGEILHANASNHQDLFAALKGGGNNLGVVTTITLRTFSQGPFLGGGIVYPDSTFDQQITAFNAFKSPANFDRRAQVELSFINLGQLNMSLASASLYHSVPERNASAFAGFAAIQPQISNTMRISNTTDFAKEIQALAAPEQL
jgi:FAD/FMN-containing dehydrogenase